jgi:superfamily II DNA/RNA helicase
MSRGLDIQDIGTVINYDAPSHIKVRRSPSFLVSVVTVD